MEGWDPAGEDRRFESLYRNIHVDVQDNMISLLVVFVFVLEE